MKITMEKNGWRITILENGGVLIRNPMGRMVYIAPEQKNWMRIYMPKYIYEWFMKYAPKLLDYIEERAEIKWVRT